MTQKPLIPPRLDAPDGFVDAVGLDDESIFIKLKVLIVKGEKAALCQAKRRSTAHPKVMAMGK